MPPETGLADLRGVGAVVIGRNEGARLIRCLRSLEAVASRSVYVDSGSDDDSVGVARRAGLMVVTLDGASPFTAARARNAGAAALLADARAKGLVHLQFIDGDCELDPGWLATAAAFLAERPDIAVACGRRRERFPDATIYNRLCDMEWNTPVGEANACGGDSLIRIEAFRSVDGFNPALIAGEEPEMCFRLRAAGWRIWRLDAEMTLHDAAIARFGQWWRRSVRGGWAYAEGASMHGASPERYKAREARSILLWGGAAPATILAAALMSLATPWAGAAAAAGLALYPAMALRVAVGRRRRFADSWSAALAYGGFTMLGKLAQMQGMARFHRTRRSGAAARLIEYKGIAGPTR